MEFSHISHEIEPIFSKDSRILILGTIPSPKSREQGFYYGHPQNRFWSVLSAVLNFSSPQSIDEKKQLLLSNHIALWDVLKSCEISGAADSSIKNAVPNDFDRIFNSSEIKQVFTTGQTAAKLYQKFTGKECICLPSPSPANCRISFEELVESYKQIKMCIEG